MSAIATAALPTIATAPAYAANNPDAQLIELGRQFLELSAEYDALEKKVDDEGLPDGGLTEKGEVQQELELKIKLTPAHTIEGLLAKASVIRYWARRETFDHSEELDAQQVALDLVESLFKIVGGAPSIAAS